MGLQRDLTFSLGIPSFAIIILMGPRRHHLPQTVIPHLWSSETVLMASGLRSSVSPNTASKLESRDKQKTVRPLKGRIARLGRPLQNCQCGLPALTVDSWLLGGQLRACH